MLGVRRRHQIEAGSRDPYRGSGHRGGSGMRSAVPGGGTFDVGACVQGDQAGAGDEPATLSPIRARDACLARASALIKGRSRAIRLASRTLGRRNLHPGVPDRAFHCVFDVWFRCLRTSGNSLEEWQMWTCTGPVRVVHADRASCCHRGCRGADLFLRARGARNARSTRGALRTAPSGGGRAVLQQQQRGFPSPATSGSFVSASILAAVAAAVRAVVADRFCTRDPDRANKVTSFATNEHFEPLTPGGISNLVQRSLASGGRTFAVRPWACARPSLTIYVHEPNAAGTVDHPGRLRAEKCGCGRAGDLVRRHGASMAQVGSAHYLFCRRSSRSWL